MTARLPLFLTMFAAFPLLAPSAHAGDLTIGFSKHGKHSSVGVQIGIPLRPRPAPQNYGGYWQTIVERTWVAGTITQVWVPPIYQTRYDACGRATQVCVRAGYWDTRQTPGYYEDRTRRVWCPAGPSYAGWNRPGC